MFNFVKFKEKKFREYSKSKNTSTNLDLFEFRNVKKCKQTNFSNNFFFLFFINETENLFLSLVNKLKKLK